MNRLLKVGDVFQTDQNGLKGKICLVTKTCLTGGGTGHGGHDIYPDGHSVRYVVLPLRQAKSLMNGRKVKNLDLDSLSSGQFYQTGCFTNMIEPSKIALVYRANLQYGVTLTLEK